VAGGGWHTATADPDGRGIRVGFLSRLELADVAQVAAFPDKLRPIQVDDTNATAVLQRLEPHILVHGSDIDKKAGWEIGQTWMRENGRQFVVLPYTEGVSSTGLKSAVRARTA